MDNLALFDLGGPDFSAAEWSLRRVNPATAKSWYAKYHYSGTAGTMGARFFGLYAPDLVAIVAIGPTSNAEGLVKKLDLHKYRGNIEITRVAVHPDSPANAASRAVAQSLKHLADTEDIQWVFSYADTGQNHHGGIYQALNAVYIGVSAARPGYLLDGKPTHPRTIVSMFGTQGKDVFRLAAERGHTIERIDGLNTAKHTYVLPCARRPKVRRKIRRHLDQYALPYPKRVADAAA